MPLEPSQDLFQGHGIIIPKEGNKANNGLQRHVYLESEESKGISSIKVQIGRGRVERIVAMFLLNGL